MKAGIRFGIATLVVAAQAGCAARADSPFAHASDDVAAATAEGRTAQYFDRISTDPVRTVLFLRDMPKGGDLHSHLSGAIYAETFIAWAAEDDVCLNVATYTLVRPPCHPAQGIVTADSVVEDASLYGDVIDAWSMRNWEPARQNGHDQFFDTFGRFGLASGSSRTGEMLAEVTSRAADGRVSYLELMWTPSGTDASALGRLVELGNGSDADFDRMRNALLELGLRDSIADASVRLSDVFTTQRSALRCGTRQVDPGCDVEVRVLYQVLRAIPPEQVFAHLLAAFEMTGSDPHVVGFNMVQPEDDRVAMRDFSMHMRMIRALRRHYPDVPVTLHAGELAPGLVPPEGLRFHIRESVRVAGARRIGHGVDIAHEDSAVALMREMAERGVLVEIALSSNVGILGVEGDEHPLHLYLRHDVPVALATDDEGVSRSSMTQEYLRAVLDQGLGYLQLKEMAENSIRYSFADDATKARLMARLQRDFEELEARYGELRTSM